jgi:hypothetical protein
MRHSIGAAIANERGEVLLESREPEGLLHSSLFEVSLGCGFLLASSLLEWQKEEQNSTRLINS